MSSFEDFRLRLTFNQLRSPVHANTSENINEPKDKLTSFSFSFLFIYHGTISMNDG